jgi:RNA polymerase sigma-70 factor (ECF subfamily)
MTEGMVMPESTLPAVSELLALARAGDPDGLNRLYEASRPWLAVLARARLERYLRARVDTSDLVQQTLLEAYRDFAGFGGRTEGEWLAWLRQILLRNAADYVRRFRAAKRAATEIPLRGEGEGPPLEQAITAAGPSPSQQAVCHEESLRLAQSLTLLPEDYQEVIQLRHFQRLAFDEVARRMQRSRPAVQMLWLRALRRLKEVLDERR